MVPPSTENTAVLRSASERRWSLTIFSLSMVPRLKSNPSVCKCWIGPRADAPASLARPDI